MSSVRAIPFDEGDEQIADPIRLRRVFISGATGTPTYSAQLAAEAAEAAQRFCNDEVTTADRRENLYAFNKDSMADAVRQWTMGSETSRFGQRFLQPVGKAAIGCAEAKCRGNRVLICRPSSPQAGARGFDAFEGFEKPQREVDAEGCEVPPEYVKRTPERYRNSLFRLSVSDAADLWLEDYDKFIDKASANLDLGELARFRRFQIGSDPARRPPEAFLRKPTDAQKQRFRDAVHEHAYKMYFPHDPEAAEQPLTSNETTLLMRQALLKVPLVAPQGVQQFIALSYRLGMRFLDPVVVEP